MTPTKPTSVYQALTTRQQVALAIAAAIHGALAREIFAGEDGKLSKQIADRSYEFADVFLAKGQA